MAENWISGALLGRSLDLDGKGGRVRLRLARSSDVGAIGALLDRQPTSFGSGAAHALVQYDPRNRYVVCATALLGGAEQLVGLGAIDIRPDEDTEPDLLIVAPDLGGPLAELLWRVLVGTAGNARRARAA